jgi:trk system potassium uptake protein TrkA
VFSAGNGEVEIYELVVPEAWRGRLVGELLAGTEAMAVAFTRAGRSLLPAPDLALAPGDILLVSATLPGIEALRERAAPAGGPR